MSQLDEMNQLSKDMLQSKGDLLDLGEDLAIYGEQLPGGELTPIVGLKEQPPIKRIGKTSEV